MKRLSVEYHGKIVNMSLPGAGTIAATVAVTDRSIARPEDSDDIFLSLGGLDSSAQHQVRWGHVDLKPGDTVRITVHDDQQFDPPVVSTKRDPKDDLDSKRKRVREMAAELGWTINE